MISNSFLDLSDLFRSEKIHAAFSLKTFKHEVDGRRLLTSLINLNPNRIVNPQQVHSSNVNIVDKPGKKPSTDAIISSTESLVLSIQVADCIPLYLADPENNIIGIVHAGWRGICKGIIEDTIKIFSSTKSLIVWIGPCISQEHYQVSKDVYYAFLEHSKLLESAFKKDDDHWHCSLSDAVKITLINLGINQIYESGLCTYQMHNEFFSYRRDGETGRIATMIWIN